jgi:DNA-binding transcriptional MocR family regulator
MDRHRVVVYCGTFSKVLFPGARVGWVVADPECIERMAALRRVTEIAPSMILQAALHELCVRGHYDRHLSRMHRTFRRRMHAAQAALREQLDRRHVEWTEPRGGYLIWLRLRGLREAWAGLDELLAAHGVELAHGDSFFPAQTPERYLRLSISALDEERIGEGIRRLGCALRESRAS